MNRLDWIETLADLSAESRVILMQISIGRPLYVSAERCELAHVSNPVYRYLSQPAMPVSREVAAELIAARYVVEGKEIPYLHRLTRDGEPPPHLREPGDGYRNGYADLGIEDADKGEIYVHLM